MNLAGHRDVVLRDGETLVAVRAEPGPEGATRLVLPGGEALLRDGDLVLEGLVVRARVVQCGSGLTVILAGQNWPLAVVDPLTPPSAEDDGGGKIIAPMPGRVVSVAVAVGQVVARGDVLLVLEAMKVQMRLPAPRDGIIAAVNAAAGDLVEDGMELVVLEG